MYTFCGLFRACGAARGSVYGLKSEWCQRLLIRLTALCISKTGQHLRTTVRGADLSARPGLKLPSGNPSNSSYVHAHIWKGGRTRGPRGVLLWCGPGRSGTTGLCSSLKSRRKTPSHHNTLYSLRYHLERVCVCVCGSHILHRDQKSLFLI